MRPIANAAPQAATVRTAIPRIRQKISSRGMYGRPSQPGSVSPHSKQRRHGSPTHAPPPVGEPGRRYVSVGLSGIQWVDTLASPAVDTPPDGVPLSWLDHRDPELLAELLSAVAKVAREGTFTLGEEVESFEREFAAYCGTEHAIGVSSGTDALALVLRALGVGAGDEVVVPANSFVATAEAASLVGASPRFADVDPETGTVTAERVNEAIGPRTRCVIAVHLYGRTAELGPILRLARDAGVPVVEDAAQAHGARYRGRRVGSIGICGCFSFYPAKNLGAWGDGGAVVTNDSDLADRVRLLRAHGERPRYRHRIVGTTSRLDALQAAVLRVKLRRLDGWNERRRSTAHALREALAGSGVTSPPPPRAGRDDVAHQYVVRADDRDRLRAHLSRSGIASAVHYPVPIHLSEAYAGLGHGPGSFPVAERLSQTICSLPVHPGVGEQEIERIASAVHAFAPAGAV
jgi:dTDP-3-amino-3,4,6-trideoxy-alpha-D-glucose transaminase